MANAGPTTTSTASDRLRELETSYLQRLPGMIDTLSLEALLDVLVCLYDECSSSTLRTERAISGFVEFCKLQVIEI